MKPLSFFFVLHAMVYQNTQTGLVSLSLCAGIGLFVLLIEVAAGHTSLVATLPPLVIIAAAAAMLSTLTVGLTRTGIEWWFSFGFLRRSLRFGEITAARARRITPLGFGIRFNFKGETSYVVTNGGAVELFLNDGRRLVVGCNEPLKVVELLTQQGVKVA